MEAENYDKTSITEPIISINIIGGSFEIGILDKRGKIELTKMTFDKNQKLIVLKTKEGIEIKIQYDDIISFVKDESNKIKIIQEENKELNNSKY